MGDDRLGLPGGEALNRRILEAMPVGVVHVSATGAVVGANGEAMRILGLSYEALTARYVHDWEPETIFEDGSTCPAAAYPVSRALATGEAHGPTTLGLRRPDGDTYWGVFTAVPVLDPESGTVSGAVATFFDVTAQKRTAAALRRSEELVRSVLESSPNPVVTCDRDGRILFVSKAPPGAAGAEAVGRFAWDQVEEASRPLVKACFARTLATGDVQTYDAVGVSGTRWRVRVAPRFEDGVIAGVTFVSWDITEYEELQSRLAVADRMAGIGTLASAVAHEINNPLTYLLANLEWVARDTAPGSPTHERCLAALEGAYRIRNVVSDVRHFSHVGQARRALIDVRDVVESALRMAHVEIRWRAQVVKRFVDVPPVIASEGRLGQVFLNLLINAAQAIPEGNIEGNRIVVSTGIDDEDHVVVEISDTGVGIPADMAAKVFEPFVTTKPRGMGTGLGLYVCRDVITSLGGSIDMQSEVGKGTVFRVTLPSAAGPKSARPDTLPPSQRRRLRVVIIDSEPRIASLLSAYLVEHDVTVVDGATAACEVMGREPFDLAFCDVVVGDKTGMDLYESTRQSRPGAEQRIVFMTGGVVAERARAFLQRIPNAVLEKPFTMEDVRRIVARSTAAAPFPRPSEARGGG